MVFNEIELSALLENSKIANNEVRFHKINCNFGSRHEMFAEKAHCRLNDHNVENSVSKINLIDQLII